MRSPTRQPWYHEGLQFDCTRCGQCCRGEPGYVWVSEDECRALARHLGLSTGEFRASYTIRARGRLSLRECQNGDCVFLRDGCTVYPVRPLQCRTYPFWPENLRSRAAWEAVHRVCPGVRHGQRRYTLVEIERLRGGQGETS